ncbi:TonB-dependent siderophore receptor [Sphingobacterium mizutaii]|uniref:TonB-dependent siderophore receptor n=1 Tax=Sphingobacterium mizutaii TaxID=1010 RepID=UPI0016281133|nr:TonB-dependent siderophore receptor [Sphingobacterium mizutaii]
MFIKSTLPFLKISLTITFLIFIPIILLAQQTGLIQGEVYTIDGKPLSYASIRLKDTRYNTAVDETGHFTLNAPAGKYVLQVTYANYTVEEVAVTVESGQTAQVDRITVQSNSTQLREVIVSDIQRNKYARKETQDIARMPLANLENPQAYSVITKELIMETSATDYVSALAQVPAAVVSNGVNDSGNGILLRGFTTYNSGMVRNGLPVNTRAVSEIFNLEKVEVLKGPSATLFGAQVTSYGGVVNNVTKKPFESFRGEVSYTTGSFGMNRLTADVNAPLNKDRTALGRFNVMGMTNDGFQNEGKSKAFGFATSLLFKAGAKTTVRLDADLYNSTKPLVAYLRNTNKLTMSNMKEWDLPYDRSLTSNDIATNRTNINIGAELEHQISENWTSRTSYLYNNAGDKGSVFMVPMIVDDNRIERRYRIFDDYSLNFSVIQQNFNGSYKVGSVENKVLLGLDATFYTNKNLYMVPFFAIYDTVSVKDQVWKPLTRSEVDLSRGDRSFGDGIDDSKYNVSSAYLSNVTNISDRFFVMLSARVNRFQQGTIKSYSPGQPEIKDENGKVEQRATPETYTETEGYTQVNVSPKIGLVYQPIKDKVSIFANYMNSFTNIAASRGIANINDDPEKADIIKWKPEQANQIEAGAKFELMDGLINATVSYYNIKVTNRLMEVTTGVNIQDGEQKSEGFEVDLIANPVRGWNIIAGYGFNENKYVKSEEGVLGKTPAWTPKHVANLWTSYKFLDNGVKGLGFGAGFNYVDKVLMNIADDFYIPSYAVVNGTVFYDQPKYRVGVKLNNIANIKYWDMYGKPQRPFEFLANLSFKF